MSTERKIVEKAMRELRIKRFLESEIGNAGISSIVIQKTPLATRIAIRAKRPNMVIGKRGITVKALTELLEKNYGVSNPQLDIIEVENPELDPKLVAQRIAKQIEIDGKIKQILRMTLNDVMNAGAIGAEIRVAGKIAGKGGKAKTLRVRAGYLKKSGDVMRMVSKGSTTAYLKAGAIGVKVLIVPPGTVFPDAVKINEKLLGEMAENAKGDGKEGVEKANGMEPEKEKVHNDFSEAKKEEVQNGLAQ